MKATALAVVCAFALAAAPSAFAHHTTAAGLRTVIDRQQAAITHYHHVLVFLRNHPLPAASSAGRRLHRRAVGHLRWRSRVLVRARSELAALAAVAFPAHHALWECIHEHEASSWQAVNPNGHYGGLQMTWGWLGYISGNPADHSQLEQEQAAERAWAASGYSSGFLVEQWLRWDNAYECLRLA